MAHGVSNMVNPQPLKRVREGLVAVIRLLTTTFQ